MSHGSILESGARYLKKDESVLILVYMITQGLFRKFYTRPSRNSDPKCQFVVCTYIHAWWANFWNIEEVSLWTFTFHISIFCSTSAFEQKIIFGICFFRHLQGLRTFSCYKRRQMQNYITSKKHDNKLVRQVSSCKKCRFWLNSQCEKIRNK